ncbi:hypothetical protein BZL29_2751 [Mycobacterium kansasii]|uniref:Uncharacterized protein n=1 Tax=Mycobacterium kansasii TaxID=1768 RepID=A0A1V3XP85_MYCKA|nr:hypothetical protein BZL29_2751 [Mycobacterium kansasii]
MHRQAEQADNLGGSARGGRQGFRADSVERVIGRTAEIPARRRR